MRLRNGKEVVVADLVHWEIDGGLSEVEIAGKLGISRMGLWKLRGRLGCPQRVRSDAGVERRPLSERVEGRRLYMRSYRRCNPEKFKRNYWRRQEVCRAVLGYIPGREVHVHHVDGDPSNWDHRNLVICDPVYHKYLHMRMLG